jgi:hypothetical protein
MIDQATHADMSPITSARDQSDFDVIGNHGALFSSTAMPLFLMIKCRAPQHHPMACLNQSIAQVYCPHRAHILPIYMEWLAGLKHPD